MILENAGVARASGEFMKWRRLKKREAKDRHYDQWLGFY